MATKVDPIEALINARDKLKKSENSATEVLYQCLADAARFIRKVMSDRKLRGRFLSHFKGERIAKRLSKEIPLSKLRRLVLRFLFNAPASGPAYDRARIYAQALGTIPKSVATKDIPAYIRDHGGIEKLYEEANAQKTAKVGKPIGDSVTPVAPSLESDVDSDGGSDRIGTTTDGDSSKPTDTVPSGDGQPDVAAPRKTQNRVRMKSDEHLLVSMSKEVLHRILAHSGTLTLHVEVDCYSDGQVPVTLTDWELS
ncbi:hypothetical protein [Aureimonas frigidaquae]|uniref:Uncharacterized protein n=1 Tax=Aureimonas frigidaquae TaxID=424757 RepID=A0A0N7KXM9_9HYPH|nr:hypothetical protein [Aureimonas frigidaquae]BAT27369.1 hypothetical protein [Aureimonas frigidaquae]